jgi:DNA-binding transcriptional LysR family regulator
MEIRQLNTLIAVVQYDSFTLAAEKLGYTQPSVTAQIRQLEIELGVRLFERLRKKLYLTAEGECLLEYARQMVSLSAEAKHAVAEISLSKGILRVGALESLSSERLPKIFAAFHEHCPEVEIVLKIAGIGQLQRMLRENQIDAACYLDVPQAGEDFSIEVSIPEPMLLLASPRHPLAGEPKVTPEMLADWPLILSEEGCSYRRVFLESLAKEGMIPKSTMEIGSMVAIRQLAAEGAGVTLLPRFCVREELEANRLVALKWSGPSFQLYTELVCHKEKWRSPVLAAFLKLAAEMLDPQI